MTELADDTQPAMCYPKEVQYEHWKCQADKMGYKSVSRFMIEMVETGYKQLDLTFGYDQETQELREQRNDLKRELDHTRSRLQEVEQQLYEGERESIITFVEDHLDSPTFAEIVQHVINDTPLRVANLLKELDGNRIEYVDGRYKIREDSNDV